MGNERKSLRIGAVAILGAVALRLLANALPVLAELGQNAAAWLIFSETGRWPAAAQTAPAATTQTVAETVLPQQEPVIFTAAQAVDIPLHNTSAVEPDISLLLTKPLVWNLKSDSPRVLILHTHACESYADSGGYRSVDEQENMIAVGEVVKQRLEAAGIAVIHDKTLHDQMSYDGAYDASRQTAQSWLAKYPDICLILDLHRDAIEDSNGNQLATTVQVNDQQTAKVMLVLGMGYRWDSSTYWEQNLALGAKLYVQLETLAPGICRSLCLRGYRYNQDLGPCSLLVEMGAAGNTLSQAKNAGQILADALISLSQGSG